MPELNEYLQKWKAKVNGLSNFVSTTLGYQVAKEATEAIQKRVVGTGMDYKGDSFSPYSSNWSAQRAKKGLGSKKNFSFTGGTMNSLQKVNEKKTKVGTVITLDVKGKSKDADGRKKIRSRDRKKIEDGHTNYEGVNILEISDKEIKDIEDKLVVKLERYLDVT